MQAEENIFRGLRIFNFNFIYIRCSGEIMKNIFKVFYKEFNATNNIDKSVPKYIINDSG